HSARTRGRARAGWAADQADRDRRLSHLVLLHRLDVERLDDHSARTYGWHEEGGLAPQRGPDVADDARVGAGGVYLGQQSDAGALEQPEHLLERRYPLAGERATLPG